MAMLFELWVECRCEAHAMRMVPHFNGVRNTLITGCAVTWQAVVDYENKCAVSVFPQGLNTRGVVTEKDRIEQLEAGLRLYHHLLKAPDFCYAHAARLAYLDSLEETLADHLDASVDNQARLTLDCVFDDAVWNRFGRPCNARPFRPGYWTTIIRESWSAVRWSELLERGQFPELRDIYRELQVSNPMTAEERSNWITQQSIDPSRRWTPSSEVPPL